MKDIMELVNDVNKLEKQLQSELNNIANDLLQKTKDNITIEVYDKYEPKQYNRTYNLQNAVTKSNVRKNSNQLEVDIYIDDNIAQSYHMNNLNCDLETYAEIVETGVGYDFNFEYTGKPRAYMQKTYIENENNIINKIGTIIKTIV